MRLLLDTHALIWWAVDDTRLRKSERDAIADRTSEIWVSAASFWEISIKASLGRIELDQEALEQEARANNFLELPISWRHAEAAGSLPRHHDDPFDHMLIAQAQVEQLVLITYDGAFREYDVPLAPKRG